MLISKMGQNKVFRDYYSAQALTYVALITGSYLAIIQKSWWSMPVLTLSLYYKLNSNFLNMFLELKRYLDAREAKYYENYIEQCDLRDTDL